MNAPAKSDRLTLVCSCEDTMPLDTAALKATIAGTVVFASHLCGPEQEAARLALGSGRPVTIACTAMTRVFEEIAGDLGRDGQALYVNIRETAGWSAEAPAAAPKMAALIAASAEPMPPIALVPLESEGVALILGRDLTAIEVGRKLADKLDVTVVLTATSDAMPLGALDFPVAKGRIRAAKGVLGSFEVVLDGFALPAPSSRAALAFGAARDGAVSTCDIVIDLTGGLPLFPAHDLRPGYVRADPADPAAVMRAVYEAGNLVGTFDKPRYVTFTEGLCAHSRSKKTGCTRCLSVCPTGAITPAGDHVAIDPAICGGCGACASVCPTGAAAYALPPVDAVLRRLRALLTTYRMAGGTTPHVLLHDGDHGDPLIEALARFGEGLPAHVLPLKLNEVTQAGPELFAAAFAWGATGVSALTRAKPKHDIASLEAAIGLANTLAAGLGYGEGLVTLVQADDPDALAFALGAAPPGTPSPAPSGFLAMGTKRGVLETAVREMHHAAPAPVDVVALAKGAPFGGLDIHVEGCTLCLSCVSACPTGALSDNQEKPMLRFTEQVCVQCGLCAATCPEKVITLKPQADFAAWTAGKRTVKEEEPFHCVNCAKPFGTKSTIERVVSKLRDRHWMFTGVNEARTRVLMMCEECRVEAVINESFDPYGAPSRPRVRTTEDYLRERDEGKDDLS